MTGDTNAVVGGGNLVYGSGNTILSSASGADSTYTCPEMPCAPCATDYSCDCTTYPAPPPPPSGCDYSIPTYPTNPVSPPTSGSTCTTTIQAPTTYTVNQATLCTNDCGCTTAC